MSSVSGLARIALSLGLPAGLLDRGPSLRGTKFLAKAALKARLSGGGQPFQMVNVGACDGALFDDVTPWLHRIPRARAVLVEPIPYNQKRLRANYPDTERFIIEPVAVTKPRARSRSTRSMPQRSRPARCRSSSSAARRSPTPI